MAEEKTCTGAWQTGHVTCEDQAGADELSHTDAHAQAELHARIYARMHALTHVHTEAHNYVHTINCLHRPPTRYAITHSGCICARFLSRQKGSACIRKTVGPTLPYVCWPRFCRFCAQQALGVLLCLSSTSQYQRQQCGLISVCPEITIDASADESRYLQINPALAPQDTPGLRGGMDATMDDEMR